MGRFVLQILFLGPIGLKVSELGGSTLNGVAQVVMSDIGNGVIIVNIDRRMGNHGKAISLRNLKLESAKIRRYGRIAIDPMCASLGQGQRLLLPSQGKVPSHSACTWAQFPPFFHLRGQDINGF